jgi:hypothetical protein
MESCRRPLTLFVYEEGVNDRRKVVRGTERLAPILMI